MTIQTQTPAFQELAHIDWQKALVRSNVYTSARYTLTPDAHRLLSVAISAIAQGDQWLITFRIYVKQLIEFYPGLKNDKNAIARVDLATDVLMGSFIKIKQTTGRIKKHLIHSCQFIKCKGAAYVDIRLHDEMLPYLINVKGNFSAPKLENIRYFKKDQHFKLHAFLYSHLFRGQTWIISIEQLRDVLDLKKTTYQLVGHLKSRLLLPSIQLINQVTDISVSIEDVKRGRQITGFIFHIRKQSSTKTMKQNTMPRPEISWEKHKEKINQNQELSKQFEAIGFTYSEFRRLLNRYNESFLGKVWSSPPHGIIWLHMIEDA